MHAFSIIQLVLVATSLVHASPAVSTYQPDRSHFSSEDNNKAAPFYDLSAFGVHTGQLPKVYDISGGNFTYLPDESFKVFTELKSGLRNRTAQALEAGGIGERAGCESINMDLTGNCGTFNYNVSISPSHF